MDKFHNGKIEIISPVVRCRSQPALNVNICVGDTSGKGTA